MDSYFNELENVNTGSELYSRWKSYILAMTKEDIKLIVENGLTYQANSLKSMIRELVAGQRVPETLLEKMDSIASATAKTANKLR